MAQIGERAVLAGIAGPRGSWPIEDALAEFEELARGAGAEPVDIVVQRHNHYDPATLFSSGKVEELAAAVSAHRADVVLCSRNLSPRQQHRLEDAVGCTVIDRTRLILDIFATRARSREGKLQVELAQWLYLLPRLAGLGRDLSRTGGGIGTRGPGETKLAADRRRVTDRIVALRAELAAVAATREVQRGGRRRGELPVVAMVGYTNAGKSTLHRALCGSDVLVADQLFATLDPTTRALELPQHRRALLVDTVGFIHDLPPALVAAFAATLEEVTRADLLLEVVDASHARRLEQRAAVQAILGRLGAVGLPRIVVWNKTDLPEAEPAVPAGGEDAPPEQPAIAISAATGAGIPALRALIAATLPEGRRQVDVKLPFAALALVTAAQEQAEIVSLRYDGDGVALVARCAPALASRLEEAAAPR